MSQTTKPKKIKASATQSCPCGPACACSPCQCGTSCHCAERAKASR